MVCESLAVSTFCNLIHVSVSTGIKEVVYMYYPYISFSYTGILYLGVYMQLKVVHPHLRLRCYDQKYVWSEFLMGLLMKTNKEIYIHCLYKGEKFVSLCKTTKNMYVGCLFIVVCVLVGPFSVTICYIKGEKWKQIFNNC